MPFITGIKFINLSQTSMLNYIDLCLKITKLLQQNNIKCPDIMNLVEHQMDLLQQGERPPVLETYEEIIVKQLDFYRTEAQKINQIRNKFELQNKQLKAEIQEQKDINHELNKLVKQLKQELFKAPKYPSSEKPDSPGRHHLPPQIEPPTTHRTKPITFAFNKTVNQRDSFLSPQLTIEIKNIKTPVLEVSEPDDLRSLFRECVKQLQQDLRKRFRSTTSPLFRDHMGEIKLPEEVRKIPLQKLDLRALYEKFFQHPHFIRMVEAQIFNLKCCNNMNCLYNFQKAEQQLLEQPQPPVKLTPKLLNQTCIKSFRLQNKNRSLSIGNKQDNRLQYQQLFAEVLRLERELLTTNRQDRKRVLQLEQELKEATSQLQSLTSKILH